MKNGENRGDKRQISNCRPGRFAQAVQLMAEMAETYDQLDYDLTEVSPDWSIHLLRKVKIKVLA